MLALRQRDLGIKNSCLQLAVAPHRLVGHVSGMGTMDSHVAVRRSSRREMIARRFEAIGGIAFSLFMDMDGVAAGTEVSSIDFDQQTVGRLGEFHGAELRAVYSVQGGYRANRRIGLRKCRRQNERQSGGCAEVGGRFHGSLRRFPICGTHQVESWLQPRVPPGDPCRALLANSSSGPIIDRWITKYCCSSPSA